MGTKTAAAFPGLHDRLVHFASALLIIPGGVVEADKGADEDADAPIPPTVVEAGNVADASLADELVEPKGVLVGNEPEL
jgi:hypothetical protein